MIFGGKFNSIKKIYKYLYKTDIYNVSGKCTCICSAPKCKT